MGLMETLVKHPDEIRPLVKLKVDAMRAQRAIPKDPYLAFCYRMLMRVSRSFSIVIQQLRTELRDAVCVFYLVLRGLDTIEDDMAIPIDIKVPILKSFHEHIYDPSWKFVCGEKDYKELMNKFECVSNAFLNLDEGYQRVIAEMTNRMGVGMAKFIETEVLTVEDYNEYCHYVAGLVGLGLTRLFHASGLESFQPDDLSNSMGLFLQKANIIRDYLEDINEIPAPRMFWPHEIWGKFGTRLEIMAIGTLAECYNNINVFRGVVKIRRGITAKVMQTKTISDVYGTFFDFSRKIAEKIGENDDSASATRKHIEDIQEYCESHLLETRVYSIDQEYGLDILVFLVVFSLLSAMVYMLYNHW
ncbi:squalene synthase 1 isoform X2 [Physcomitrium patens]|uniref:squalene synthase 1 isoform X2 n=1 Tax=Physcomitrium patens TaxID=3218 RepID=UPI003CCD26C8